MASWYSSCATGNTSFSDPFLGITTKLTVNKNDFLQFLKNEYNIKHDLQIDYKRSTQI
jgi:hypothetical protein